MSRTVEEIEQDIIDLNEKLCHSKPGSIEEDNLLIAAGHLAKELDQAKKEARDE